jgi:spermidine/putrescine-binding protein
MEAAGCRRIVFSSSATVYGKPERLPITEDASLQATNPDLEWLIPEQGGMQWVDNAMIPVGAKNVEGANKFLNYIYDPAVAGPLYESISYIPPVTGATQYMTATAQASPFIVPPATPPLYEFDVVSADVAEEISRAFVAATEQ